MVACDPIPCRSGPHCIRWPYASLFNPVPCCVVEPVSMSWNCLAVMEFVGVRGIVVVAVVVSSGKFCGGLNLVRRRLRREGWEKTNHDENCGSFW